MEDTLRGLKKSAVPATSVGLNPCFNGRYSQREQNLRILEFRGFDNSKTYKIGFCKQKLTALKASAKVVIFKQNVKERWVKSY